MHIPKDIRFYTFIGDFNRSHNYGHSLCAAMCIMYLIEIGLYCAFQQIVSKNAPNKANARVNCVSQPDTNLGENFPSKTSRPVM